jgi:hypothetical protein
MKHPVSRRGPRTAAPAVVLAVLLMLALVMPASAAFVNPSGTVNGGASATVAPGATLNVSLTVSLSSGTQWRRTGWEIRDIFGNSVSSGCVNTADHTSDGGPYTESFNVTAPNLGGTYTLGVSAYSSSSNCSGTASTPVDLGVNVTMVFNPDLNAACGLKIALVLDASGSVSSSATYVRNAVTSMVNLLKDTGSQVAIVEFATTADTPVPYTLVTAASIASTFNPYVSTDFATPGPQYYDGRVGQYTNWDDGLRQVNALPTPPDLVLFFTDGQPNTVHGGNGGSASESVAIAAAVTQADIIKQNGGNAPGAGSHIFAIGVGDVQAQNFAPITDGANYLRYVTGTPASGQTNNFSIADYFIGNFSELENSLSAFVTAVCGGTINVTKLIDADGNLQTTNDQTYAQGWTFSTNPDAPATSTPTSDVTDVNGSANFKIAFGGQTSAIVDVSETAQAGYDLLSAACTGATTSNGSWTSGSGTVNNVQLGPKDIVTCKFINWAHNAQLTIKKTVLNMAGTAYCPDRSFGFSLNATALAQRLRSSACAQPIVSEQTLTVRPGNYTIAETDADINVLPDGWLLTNVACAGSGVSGDFAFISGQNAVTGDLGPDQAVTCEFTNQQASPLAVDLLPYSATQTADGVTVAWETVSETDNAGFNVYRGTAEAGPWTQVNAALIAAQTPGAAQGNAYAYVDKTALAAGTYYYALEDVSTSGNATRHTPVSVTVAGPNAVTLRTLNASAANRSAIVTVVALVLGGLGLGLAWLKRQ